MESKRIKIARPASKPAGDVEELGRMVGSMRSRLEALEKENLELKRRLGEHDGVIRGLSVVMHRSELSYSYAQSLGGASSKINHILDVGHELTNEFNRLRAVIPMVQSTWLTIWDAPEPTEHYDLDDDDDDSDAITNLLDDQ